MHTITGISLLALAVSAQAGWTLNAWLTVYPDETKFYAKVLILSSDMKVDTEYFTGENTDLIFFAQKGLLRQINHDEKTYQDMDQKSLSSVSSGVQSAVNFIKSIFSKEEDQPGDKDPSLVITKTDKIKEIDSLKCRKYEIVKKEHYRQDVWLASWDEVSMTSAEFEPARQLGKFYELMMQSFHVLPFNDLVKHIPLEGILALDGYPVVLTHHNNDTSFCRFILSRPLKRPISKSEFNISKEYKKSYWSF